MTTQKKENKPAVSKPTQSERFTAMIVKEFTSSSGDSTGLTQFHKRLCQNYFIQIDQVLKDAETKRLKKSEKYRDETPLTWENVNMNQLALNVVAVARIGLDPAQPNHINMVPYKNNTTNKYDIGFLPGYRGIELKATKYGLRPPDDVIVELVYSNDTYEPIKKDSANPVETYIFKVNNAFDRGDLQGGFYYHLYNKEPYRNKLVSMSIIDIEKRKPKYASPEFWGGEKDRWENGKKVGKETVVGWYDEMCWKTIYRAAYGNITIDSQKIDDDFLNQSSNETNFLKDQATKQSAEQIKANANKTELTFDYAEIVPEKENSVGEKLTDPEPIQEQEKVSEPVQTEMSPGF